MIRLLTSNSPLRLGVRPSCSKEEEGAEDPFLTPLASNRSSGLPGEVSDELFDPLVVEDDRRPTWSEKNRHTVAED